MASGKVHTGASLAASSFAVTTGLLMGSVEAVVIGVGCLLGAVLTPDLDVDNGVYSYYLVDKFTGRFGRTLWTMWWNAYAGAFRHRSWLSHTPILGTLIRLIYILFPPIVLFVRDQEGVASWKIVQVIVAWSISIALILCAIILYSFFPFPQLLDYLPYLIGGLIISDFLHWIFDRF